MTECEVCGTPVSGGSAFTCSYCGGTFCPSHRLPFNHACPRIEDWKNSRTGNERRPERRKKSSLSRIDQKTIIAGAVVLVFLALLLFWVVTGK